MRKSVLLVIFFGLIGLIPQTLMGQTSNTATDIITLLESLNQRFNVTFNYSVRKLQHLELTRPAANLDLEQTLNAIAEQLPLEFRPVQEKVYAVIPVLRPLNFRVQDASDNTPIDLIYVNINGKKLIHLLPNEGSYTLRESFPSDSLEIKTSFYQPIFTTAASISRAGGLVQLAQDTINLGEVTILDYLTSGVTSVLGDHRVEINMKDLSLLAGETDGDIFRVLQAIPGIRSPNGKPGNLNLRGSPFDQNLTLFDNIPIYHTGHFFGTFSPYNPAVVENISVYRGNLPARYGGRVGGLINLETSNDIPDSLEVGVLANTVLGGMQVAVPLGKKWAIRASGRISYDLGDFSPKLQAFRKLNLQGTVISENTLAPDAEFTEFGIDFNDINGKLIFKPTSGQNLSFSFLSVISDFNYDLREPSRRSRNTQTSELTNLGFTLRGQSQWTDRFSSDIQFTRSNFKIDETRTSGRNRMLINNSQVINEVEDTRFSAVFNWDIAQSSQLNFGYEFSEQSVNFDQNIDSRNPDDDIARFRDDTRNSQAAFVSLEQNFASRLILNLGARAELFSFDNTSFFNPRLSLTYLATKSLYIKASSGKAQQYIRQDFNNDFDDFRASTYFWQLANQDVRVLKGAQNMVGFTFDKGNWLIDLELYENDIDNIAEPGQQETDRDFGELYTIGADLLIKRRWSKIETWLSYTLAKTEESVENRMNQSDPVYYDQRHVLSLTTLYPVKRWNFAFTWSYASGLPAYPPGSNPLDQDADPFPNNIEIPYTGNFPAQHQLDLSASYTFSPASAGWNGVVGLSIINLYDRENVINYFQDEVDPNDFIRFGLGFVPSLQVKVTF